MIREIGAGLTNLKRELQKSHHRQARIIEAIPNHTSESLPIEERHLEQLHTFARKNPIYYDSHEQPVCGIPCTVYEGDIDRYWLSSIGHASSRAPFSPTWIGSAYLVSCIVRDMGFGEIVDIGSGDGRIAFCAGILGMKSFSIEIDGELARLQESLSDIFGFKPHCSDATTFDYSSLPLKCPVMVIGGIAQMGGAELAGGVMDRISDSSLSRHGWVFTGSHSPKYRPDPKNEAGWGTLIEDRNLEVLQRISLPTAWTLHESEETPYIFAVPKNSNPN